jgi:hypothetical protein
LLAYETGLGGDSSFNEAREHAIERNLMSEAFLGRFWRPSGRAVVLAGSDHTASGPQCNRQWVGCDLAANVIPGAVTSILLRVVSVDLDSIPPDTPCGVEWAYAQWLRSMRMLRDDNGFSGVVGLDSTSQQQRISRRIGDTWSLSSDDQWSGGHDVAVVIPRSAVDSLNCPASSH